MFRPAKLLIARMQITGLDALDWNMQRGRMQLGQNAAWSIATWLERGLHNVVRSLRGLHNAVLHNLVLHYIALHYVALHSLT